MWNCNLQHNHSSNYCWNCDINLLTKGKLRVNCQQWKELGMDNVLQTWLHLLLLIKTVCTIWLHFWVDKSTEPKIGSTHTCIVPVMNDFIIAKGMREPLIYPSYPSHADSQTDTSPRHNSTDKPFCPGPPLILHFLHFSDLP